MVTSVNNSQIKNIQQQFLKQQKNITERSQSFWVKVLLHNIYVLFQQDCQVIL